MTIEQRRTEDPAQEPNSEVSQVAVRPEFALLVFGMPGLIALLVTIIGLRSPLEILAGLAWSGSLFAVALRGFFNTEKDAFVPIRSPVANLMPVFLVIFGAIAVHFAERSPAVFLFVLAAAWAVVAPAWQPLWKSKAAQFVGGLMKLVQLALFVAVLLYLAKTLIWG